MIRFDTPTARLRAVTFIEGLSYALLLFVAMPLKYLADMPLAVRLVGGAHGLLFTWLMVLIAWEQQARHRNFRWSARLVAASLLPFGFLVVDRGLRAEDEDYRRSRAEG